MTVVLLTLGAAIVAGLVAHECGHALAAQLLRLPWRPVLHWHGPGIRIGSDEFHLSRRQVILTAAAGPIASLAFAAAVWRLHPMTGAVSVELAFWNLVLPRSDGAVIARALRGKPYRTEAAR